LKDIELYQEAEEDVVGAGKGSGSFILPGLQKLRRICNTSDGQPDDTGLVQEQGKGKGEEQGHGQRKRGVQGRGVGLVIAKKEDRKDCQKQEHAECKSENFTGSKAVKLEHLESEIVFETDKISSKVEPNTLILSCTDEKERNERERLYCDTSAASAGVLVEAGDHYVQDRCTHDDLEIESQIIVKDVVGADKYMVATEQSKRQAKGNEEEDNMEDKKDDPDADEGKGRAAEEGELSMLSNGRIEFITPTASKKNSKPFVALAKSDQKTVITSSASDASIDPVKNMVLGALKSVPKGPGQGPKGWVVPTKKNFIPAKIVMPSKTSSVFVKESDSSGGGDDNDENERDKIDEKEKEQEKEKDNEEDKIGIYKSTAQRVVVVKRLHNTVSKHLTAPVPVLVVVTAESLLAGSGKLQVGSTSTSILPLPLHLTLP
jgi:hypothetical protein